MTDPARGPTTEELRARALAAVERARESADVIDSHADALADLGATHGAVAAHGIARRLRDDAAELEAATTAALLLPRPCLACNREQGERMCDLCQRLEVAEASA